LTGSNYCVQCGTTYLGDEQDPALISAERAFLLEQAVELTHPESPAFMGLEEEELEWKARSRPNLPLTAASSEERWGSGDKKALLSRLARGSSRKRAEAALRLATTRDPDVVFGLLKQLGDRDDDVRCCALWALGLVGNPLIVPPLLEFAKVERDRVVRRQLAATLYAILVSSAEATRSRDEDAQKQIDSLTDRLVEDPGTELFLKRGRLRMKTGIFLKAAGDFSRCLDDSGVIMPRALLSRSQVFLLMGKPLFALDDLISCPTDYDYPPVFVLHRAALITLARQIVSTARDKGLTDYARLFERRLQKLDGGEEPAS